MLGDCRSCQTDRAGSGRSSSTDTGRRLYRTPASSPSLAPKEVSEQEVSQDQNPSQLVAMKRGANPALSEEQFGLACVSLRRCRVALCYTSPPIGAALSIVRSTRMKIMAGIALGILFLAL